MDFADYILTSPLTAGMGQENPGSRQAFLDRFEQLTEQQKSLLAAPETAVRISSIGESFDLTTAQTEFLAIIIREVISGLAKPGDIAPLLVEHLGIDRGAAVAIADRIWNEVLNASSTAMQPERIAPGQLGATAPRRLNQQSSSQEGETDHIIDLRQE